MKNDTNQRREWIQSQDVVALALALRLVVELTIGLPVAGMPNDISRDINALHGAIRDVEIGLGLGDAFKADGE